MVANINIFDRAAKAWVPQIPQHARARRMLDIAPNQSITSSN